MRKYLLLLLLFACATPMPELIEEAESCVANHIDPKTGIIGKPDAKARKACWAPVNERLESAERAEQRKAQDNQCCMRNGHRMPQCFCIDPKDPLLRRY